MPKVGRSGNLGFRDGPPLPHVHSSHTSAQKVQIQVPSPVPLPASASSGLSPSDICPSGARVVAWVSTLLSSLLLLLL